MFQFLIGLMQRKLPLIALWTKWVLAFFPFCDSGHTMQETKRTLPGCPCSKVWIRVIFYKFLLSPHSLPVQFSSVQLLSHVRLLRPHGPQHARPPCPSPTPRVYPNICPLSWWCHPTISSSVIPFSCPQSFPASGSFQMSQLFAFQVAKVLEFQLQHQSFQWTPRTDFL